jgi:hypothetical protein
MGIVISLHGEGQLLEIVRALNSPRRLARRLDGGQEEADQEAEDGGDDQDLDQCEGAAAMRLGGERPHRFLLNT